MQSKSLAFTETVRGPATDCASARSQCYQFLSQAFAFPQPDFFQDVKEGRWPAEAASLLSALPYRLRLPAGFRRALPADYDAFQAEYIRLFEVGPRGGAPCPLYGGHYARDRLRAMEELVRFYNFFGLRLSPGRMPDHVTVELEFMHYLSFKEAEAAGSPEEAESYRRAQRDFLDRQLATWLPRVVGALHGQRPLPFYGALVRLAARFVEYDRRYVGGPDSGRGS